MKDFNKKVVLITGATSGIGEATAKEFANAGADVVMVGRNQEKGKKIEQLIGEKAYFIKCDVSKESEVEQMVKMAVEKFGKIDVLFNNAGVMLPSMEVERMPIEDWDKTFATNIRGMFLVTKFAKPFLLESKGTIINNASIAGLQYYAAGRSYAYSASKAAVVQFSHQMAKNYGEDGIRVNCIAPGIVDTPILGDRDRDEYVKRVPLKRLAKPEDIAKIVVFLASDDANYLTGVVLPIDGGCSL